jgi:hypothetical protein
MGPKVQQEPCPWFGRVKVWSQTNKTKQNKTKTHVLMLDLNLSLN